MSAHNDTQDPDIHIEVENFGPIEKAEIDLRPLTVFVGESNTGKTYFAALIYALHQSFDGSLQFPWSKIDLYSLHYRSSSNRSDSLEELQSAFELILNPKSQIKFSDFPKWIRSELRSKLKKPKISREQLIRCFDLESISDLIRFYELKSKKKSRLSIPTLTKGETYKMKLSLKILQQNQTLWSHHIHDTGSDPLAYGYINDNMQLFFNNKRVVEKNNNVDDFLNLLLLLEIESKDIYYLPAARSGILQSHGVIVSSVLDRITRVGLEHFSEIAPLSGMIVDFLKQMINYKESVRSDSDIYNVAKLLENDVLRGQIEIRRPEGVGYPQFLYRPINSEHSIRMSRSSSMVSELAPLVIFLRGIVDSGDTLIIEEPESHLHPRAQTKIAITLARLVRAGVRVIITTHSDWLLEQIGNLVREGEVMKLDEELIDTPTTWLTEDEVGAWRFHTDKPVEEIKFDLITGFEPQDYGEVAEDLYNRSVELRTLLRKKLGDNTVE